MLKTSKTYFTKLEVYCKRLDKYLPMPMQYCRIEDDNSYLFARCNGCDEMCGDPVCNSCINNITSHMFKHCRKEFDVHRTYNPFNEESFK